MIISALAENNRDASSYNSGVRHLTWAPKPRSQQVWFLLEALGTVCFLVSSAFWRQPAFHRPSLSVFKANSKIKSAGADMWRVYLAAR